MKIRQARRARLSSRIVKPIDLCSWNRAKVVGEPLGPSPMRQPMMIWKMMAAAISQCRTIATVV